MPLNTIDISFAPHGDGPSTLECVLARVRRLLSGRAGGRRAASRWMHRRISASGGRAWSFGSGHPSQRWALCPILVEAPVAARGRR